MIISVSRHVYRFNGLELLRKQREIVRQHGGAGPIFRST